MIKSKDLLAGMFVIFGIVFLLFGIAWADKLLGIFDDRREIRVLMPRGVPIEVGQAVRMEGLRVGEVVRYQVRSYEERRNEYPQHHLALVLKIDDQVPVGANTEIVLTGDGLLGARYIQLRAPSGPLAPLPPDRTLLGKLGGVDYFLEGMREMTDTLVRVLAGLERMTAAEDTDGSILQAIARLREGFTPLLGEAETSLRELREAVNALRPELGRALRETGDVMSELREVIAENREQLPEVLMETRSTLRGLRESLARVEGSATQLADSARGSLEQLEHLLRKNDTNLFLLLHNLRVASDELKVGLARLFADPSQLLFGGNLDPEAAAEAARRSLEEDLLDRRRLPPRDKR